jgi:hypothetical protein
MSDLPKWITFPIYMKIECDRNLILGEAMLIRMVPALAQGGVQIAAARAVAPTLPAQERRSSSRPRPDPPIFRVGPAAPVSGSDRSNTGIVRQANIDWGNCTPLSAASRIETG